MPGVDGRYTVAQVFGNFRVWGLAVFVLAVQDV